ncbi:MAG: hypothetical protein WC142_07045 [Bacteroidales bacterium]|jgi:hypothetical protein|nr:hypothetical protein [Bacteroidales bacterium]MDD2687640.1 hypothetical protein [Bacteroidales bacterium]MDD3330136.1 hypothetical protein [Bacteroidales bacterium]MDD3690936.1 hypothetical protein [Bacteroidales bacterium]NLO42595.1 hypothetical protein [Bacteroidales bacterium]
MQLTTIKLSFLLCILSFLISCNKESKDYRDEFVGNYLCHQTGGCYTLDTTYPKIDTTLLVTVTKVEDSLITILNVTLKLNPISGTFGVDENGYVIEYPGGSGYRIFKGYFSNDSIVFHTFGGGHGGGCNYDYKGIKQ